MDLSSIYNGIWSCDKKKQLQPCNNYVNPLNASIYERLLRRKHSIVNDNANDSSTNSDSDSDSRRRRRLRRVSLNIQSNSKQLFNNKNKFTDNHCADQKYVNDKTNDSNINGENNYAFSNPNDNCVDPKLNILSFVSLTKYFIIFDR